MELNIAGLDKAQVLKALYDNAKPQGMGFLHYQPDPMDIEEAKILVQDNTYFDYVKGRVMKVNLLRDTLRCAAYDRDNGEGAAQRALQHLL
jgi:hypothetical protein